MALVQRRELKADKLAGRSIWQDSEKKKTIYSNIFMKNNGYVINDENAAEYYNYSLRTIESLFGAAVVTVLTSKLLYGIILGTLIHTVLSLLFYLKYLKKLPKITKVEKYKKDNYIKQMSSELSFARLIVVVILTLFASYIVIYAKQTKDYSVQIKNLLVVLHIVVSLFALLNVATIIYKAFRKNK